MSTRKKRKPTENIPQPIYKGSSISIDPSLMGHFGVRGRNPLDTEMASEDAMLAQELKNMRVDEIILKRKARMAKLQRELTKLENESQGITHDGSGMPKISFAMAQQISNLPEAEQRKVIETYAMLSSMSSKNGQNSMLPLLIGFSKTNQGNPQSDMATYAKAMSDQFQSGIAVMQSVTTKEKPSNATELLKIFRDLVADSVKKPMEELAKNMTAQPSAFEQILMNPEMFSRAKEIGMFGGKESTGASTNIDLEIEKMRGERELQIKHLDLEWRKSLMEVEAKDRRTDSILSALAPLSALFAGPVSQRMEQLGQQTVATHGTPPPTQTASPPTGSTVLLKCLCGHEETKSFPGEPPEVLQCSSCGQELRIGGAPPGANA